MKYMLLLNSDPTKGPTPGTPEFAATMQEWFAYSAALVEAGAMVSGDPLQGVETATTVKIRNGERVVTDGPFIESKEVLGGYYVIDVDDLDSAIDWAAKIPNAHIGTIEVRPLMEIPGA